MESVLFRRIECLMGRSAGPLAMASHAALAGCLAAPLVPQKYGRSICVVRVDDVVQKLSAMMHNTRRLTRVTRLLLIVLLEADF